MTKFPSREDPGYDAILGELQRWIKAIRQAKQDTSHSGEALMFGSYIELEVLELRVASRLYPKSSAYFSQARLILLYTQLTQR